MEEEHETNHMRVDCFSGIPALPRETGTRNKAHVPSSKLNRGIRRVCINLDPSNRSNKRREQQIVINVLIPEHFPALSIRISELLDDMGVGKCTVMERRVSYLWRERMHTITHLLEGWDVVCFHFGSQSEGTTTLGLNSDIDILLSHNTVNIMTDWRDWKAGMYNFLMLHENINPPQQYLLQVIRQYTPEPSTSLGGDVRFVRKDSGQVLLSSEQWKKEAADILEYEEDITTHGPSIGHIKTNGPSVCSSPNFDSVTAFHVCQPLPEIQHWIDRCRGRRWPPAQLLEAARVAPSFLVPAGHPDSDYNCLEWRLSPNLIERMLMFSFNMTQIKCYIVLKMIKQSLFSKMVGDFTTSFHCKTLMFYTIERTHPSVWKEHNLVFLLLLCLQLLRKWLRLGIFPHYIIEGVNLFDWKVSVVQQRRLLQYVDYLINNNLQDLFYIDIDTLGCRLQACGVRRIGKNCGVLGRLCLHQSIRLLLSSERLMCFLFELRIRTAKVQNTNTTFEQDLDSKLLTCFEYLKNAKLKSEAVECIHHLFALHNSMQASKCLRQRCPVVSKIIRRFQYSLNTDLASSRLKLASVLYCCGYLHAAVRVLEDVEWGFHNNVKSVCGCYQAEKNDLRNFAKIISDNCDNGFSELPFAFCVKFFRKEAYCAPYILLFEMKRNMTEDEVSQRCCAEKEWMDCAEVDARPFLYYLQYLTYGGLGERDKQLLAFGILEFYVYDRSNKINMYHIETALNLLGHCYEIEGDYENALRNYYCSSHIYEVNNAANWHVQRVQRLIIN